jgi:hypothetical protein
MAALSSFYPFVAPLVPGAPSVAMSNAVLQGAIRFCEQTLTLQRKLAAVQTVTDQANYTLVQSGEVVAKLLGAKLDGRALFVVTPADDDGVDDEDLSVTAPDEIVLAGPMLVTLNPPPLLDDMDLVVRAAMRPAQAATTVADELFERHAQAIGDWAAQWLLLQPDTAYYKPNAAAVAVERSRVLRNRSRSIRRPNVRWC